MYHITYSMKQKIQKFIVIISLVSLSSACATQSPAYDYTHKLRVGNETLLVEVVSDEKKMAQGLSGRPKLANTQGMLFDFTPLLNQSAGAYPSFWMKDMDFDLDLIWIYKNEIIGINADVLHPDASCFMLHASCNLPTYYPPSPVDMVLEVNAGWSKTNNVQVGDGVKLNAE